jgi:hypothetical protein
LRIVRHLFLKRQSDSQANIFDVPDRFVEMETTWKP